jgi:hypothetical protein
VAALQNPFHTSYSSFQAFWNFWTCWHWKSHASSFQRTWSLRLRRKNTVLSRKLTLFGCSVGGDIAFVLCGTVHHTRARKTHNMILNTNPLKSIRELDRFQLLFVVPLSLRDLQPTPRWTALPLPQLSPCPHPRRD